MLRFRSLYEVSGQICKDVLQRKSKPMTISNQIKTIDGF